MRVTVTGASDDLIEIDGDIHEEFTAPRDGDGNDGGLLAFSDGTVLRIVYDKDGLWRVTRVAKGTATFENVPGDVESDRFDIATLTGENLRWVVLGTEWARAEKGAANG